jgi:drug/metabolite transporter superfamily protein YnfA
MNFLFQIISCFAFIVLCTWLIRVDRSTWLHLVALILAICGFVIAMVHVSEPTIVSTETLKYAITSMAFGFSLWLLSDKRSETV